MIGLTIQNIYIFVETAKGQFDVEIPLEKGLNIIRAENSSGKSTCVNAIAYGLGLESILGPSRKRPFPKSLYDTILDGKASRKPHDVLSSHIRLTLQNSHEVTAIVTREVKEDINLVSVSFPGDGGELFYADGDFYIGTAGTGLGSATSEKGFHHWLSDFIGWKLPLVPKYDGKDCPLYLECIFPLFFIEQKRGWSEILANSPKHFGIKNVKRSAIEFCLGIEGFEHERKLADAQNSIEKAEREWDELKSAAEGIADYNEVRIMKMPDLDNREAQPDIEFSYLDNQVYISVSDRLSALKRKSASLAEVGKLDVSSDERYESQAAVIRSLHRRIDDNAGALETALLSEPDLNDKIQTLRNDFSQYRQLKKLKDVGSRLGELDTNKCPICESELYDTLGAKQKQGTPMTLEDNIEFLKNQLAFFESIKAKNAQRIGVLKSESSMLYAMLENESERLSMLEQDLLEVHGEVKAQIREKMQSQNLISETEKLWKSQKELNDRGERIHNEWLTARGRLASLRKKAPRSGRSAILRDMEVILRKNLDAFGFSYTDIHSVTISPKSLRPEQEGYDIVAETSASDYIRIIWSYTLALLEMAATKKEIRHGGFIMFDEPRQHEASKFSFIRLIGKASESKKTGGQVIFATSLEDQELRAACGGKDVNLVCFDDFILQLRDNIGAR